MPERFVLKNESSELPVFRDKLRGLLKENGWSERQIGEWVLVMDEALTNVMRHAYPGQKGEIIVEFSANDDQAEFVIEDHGKPFDPTQLPSPKLPKETPGGLGVYLIRSLTDRFEYDQTFRSGNRIRLMKKKLLSQEKRSCS